MSEQLKITFTHVDANGGETEIGNSNYVLNDATTGQINLQDEAKIATEHIESHLRNIGLI